MKLFLLNALLTFMFLVTVDQILLREIYLLENIIISLAVPAAFAIVKAYQDRTAKP